MYNSIVQLPARITKDFVVELYTFCQENLYFNFNDTVYRQISGTGMGKDFAPALADLKIGYDELKLEQFVRTTFSDEAANLFLTWYKRYLDDVFLIWRKEHKDDFEKIKHFMNTIDPNIKYTFEESLENPHNGAAFLDVWVTINEEGVVKTDIYSKPTDTFNYLPFSSCHPRHVVRNIPFVLARRIRGIVSDDAELTRRFAEMSDRLKRKKYPAKLIKGAIVRARALDRKDIITTNQAKLTGNLNAQEKEIHFVSTHTGIMDNSTNSARAGIESLNSLLPQSKQMRLVSSMRRSPNLGDHLVYKSKEIRQVKRCIKGCLFCNFLQEGSSIVLKNGVTIKTNANFTCTSRNLVYIIIAGKCGEHYIGETGDELNRRFALHRSQGKEGATFVPCKADQHLRICDNNQYKVFPFFRPKRNDFVLRREIERKYIRLFKPLLNGDDC